MRTERIIIIVLLSLLITGCAGDKAAEFKPVVPDENVVTVELSNRKADYQFGPIKMSEFVDSVQFVTLEETEESLIRSLYKIIFTQEHIIAVDRELGRIFFFDRDGKYIKHISRKGQGPGEYTGLSACMFDEQKQQLIIYDSFTKKMIFYDLSGNLVREIPMFSEGTIVRDIINLPNGHFLCYTFDCVGGGLDPKYIGLWEVDDDGKFLCNYFTYNVKLPVVFGTLHFQQLPDGTISLKDETHNDIYHYRNGEVEKIISYTIKGNRLPDYIGTEMFGKNPRNIRTDQFKENSDYLFTLWYDEEQVPLYSLFSKKDKTVRYWDAFYSYDAAVPGVLHRMVDSNRPDMLVCALNGDIIDKYLADEHLPESAREALQSQVQKLAGSENPVLEFLYLKK